MNRNSVSDIRVLVSSIINFFIVNFHLHLGFRKQEIHICIFKERRSIYRNLCKDPVITGFIHNYPYLRSVVRILKTEVLVRGVKKNNEVRIDGPAPNK